MKRGLLFLPLLFLSFIRLDAEEYDFRKTRWGMSKEQVNKAETADLIEEYDRILTYDASLLKYSCNINYFFKDWLAQQYGDPALSEEVWEGETVEEAALR